MKGTTARLSSGQISRNINYVSHYGVAGLTCSLLHKKGAGVKSSRNAAKSSSSNISNILLFRTRIYDISTPKILFNTVLQLLFT